MYISLHSNLLSNLQNCPWGFPVVWLMWASMSPEGQHTDVNSCFSSDYICIVVIQSLSCVRLFATPWTAACPSLSPRVCPDSCSLSQWCYLTISSSATFVDHSLIMAKWSYEACSGGPPKTDGSQWRVLTKHGALEEGMANHSSILAVRTPWATWYVCILFKQ